MRGARTYNGDRCDLDDSNQGYHGCKPSDLTTDLLSRYSLTGYLRVTCLHLTLRCPHSRLLPHIFVFLSC